MFPEAGRFLEQGDRARRDLVAAEKGLIALVAKKDWRGYLVSRRVVAECSLADALTHQISGSIRRLELPGDLVESEQVIEAVADNFVLVGRLGSRARPTRAKPLRGMQTVLRASDWFGGDEDRGVLVITAKGQLLKAFRDGRVVFPTEGEISRYGVKIPSFFDPKKQKELKGLVGRTRKMFPAA